MQLTAQERAQDFIGPAEYREHKRKRFRQSDNQIIAENDAFSLSEAETRALYTDAYERSSSLYYASEPTFEEILAEIRKGMSEL